MEDDDGEMSFWIYGEKGTCKNVNTPRGEKKMLNWGRMCVSRE
jgi:hypothetical protein